MTIDLCNSYNFFSLSFSSFSDNSTLHLSIGIGTNPKFLSVILFFWSSTNIIGEVYLYLELPNNLILG